MIWFGVLGVFLLALAVDPDVRAKVLQRFANLQECDEREVFITGRASRNTYLASIGILVFGLFLSMFSFNIQSVPEPDRIAGRARRLSIDLRFQVFETKANQSLKAPEGQIVFDFDGLPMTKSALLLGLLAWQLVAFNLSVRREKLRLS